VRHSDAIWVLACKSVLPNGIVLLQIVSWHDRFIPIESDEPKTQSFKW